MDDPFGFSEPEILSVVDSNGREMELQLITSFSLEDKKYMAFIPTQESEDDLINLELDMSDYDVNGLIIFALREGDEGEEDTLHRIVDLEELDEIQEFLEAGFDSENPALGG